MTVEDARRQPGRRVSPLFRARVVTSSVDWRRTKIDTSRDAVPAAQHPPRIAVIIPAYRAAAHIGRVLSRIPASVSHIVVVEDCSPDDTAEVVRNWRDPRVTLVRHTENQGVGGAVMTGYQAALAQGADILVKMDSDDQMDPGYLGPLIAPLLRGEADYTKGNRFLHTRELHSMPLARRIGNAGLSFMTKLASGYWNIFDPTNGYTAIAAPVARLLRNDSISKRYFFESSVLLELSQLRAVVRDVAMPAIYGDETSSLSVANSLREFAPRLFRGFCRRLFTNYFVRDFSLVALFLLAGVLLTGFGTLWGAYHWYQSIHTGRAAPTGTVMLAVLPIVLGIQFLLQGVIADIQGVPTRPLHPDLAPGERAAGDGPAVAKDS
jgi:dolichol-phosphate mannosyltransferase